MPLHSSELLSMSMCVACNLHSSKSQRKHSMQNCAFAPTACLPDSTWAWQRFRIVPKGPMLLQVAIQACWQGCGALEEVHFVLFGSDTYDIWRAEAQKRLKPVEDSGKATNASLSDGNAVEPSEIPDATSSKATEPASTDVMEDAPQESVPQHGQTGDDSTVQTLTGAKQGKAADAAQEALAAPKVLEAAEPVKETDLPSHIATKQTHAPDAGSPDADVGMVDADTDSKSDKQ